MPKIQKQKYKRTPDGRFARKESKVLKVSTKNWQCKMPVEKTTEVSSGETHYRISEEYPMYGCFIQIGKSEAIEELKDSFVAREYTEISSLPELKTYAVFFWGNVTEFEFRERGVYYVTAGGFKVLRELSYSEVIVRRYGPTSEEDRKYNQVGLDNRGFGNVGKGNFGYYNVGLENCGDHNKGVRLLGVFNTEHSGFFMFNRPVVTETPWWKINESFPRFLHLQFKYDYDSPRRWEVYSIRESFELAIKQDDWGEEHARLLALPNFDYAIFEEITGISKQELDKSYDAWYKRTHRIKSSKRK